MRSRFSSRRVVHERDTCSKFFCRASLIERNAIPRDLDFQHQAALSLASPTSASGMMRVQPYCQKKIDSRPEDFELQVIESRGNANRSKHLMRR
jgi:hypothetical protein